MAVAAVATEEEVQRRRGLARVLEGPLLLLLLLPDVSSRPVCRCKGLAAICMG